MVELEQLSLLMMKVKPYQYQQADSLATSVLRLKPYLKQPKQLPAIAAEPREELLSSQTHYLCSKHSKTQTTRI